MRKPLRIATLAGAVGAITLGGTTAALAAHGGQEPLRATTHSTSPTTAPAASAKVSQELARHIAQQRVPGAEVIATGPDHEHGRAAWDVELTMQHREYEVTVDAVTGKVISVTCSPAAPTPAQTPAARVSHEPAPHIAQQRVPSARVAEPDAHHEPAPRVRHVEPTTDHPEHQPNADAVTSRVNPVHHDTDEERHH